MKSSILKKYNPNYVLYPIGLKIIREMRRTNRRKRDDIIRQKKRNDIIHMKQAKGFQGIL